MSTCLKSFPLQKESIISFVAIKKSLTLKQNHDHTGTRIPIHNWLWYATSVQVCPLHLLLATYYKMVIYKLLKLLLTIWEDIIKNGQRIYPPPPSPLPPTNNQTLIIKCTNYQFLFCFIHYSMINTFFFKFRD